MSVNKIIVLGRLGCDVKISYTSGGVAIAFFTVATSDKFKNKQGEVKETVEWHKIKAFGKTAELCEKYLSKGRQVYIEGKNSTRKWTKDNVERESTEVLASTIQFLGSSENNNSNQQQNSSNKQSSGMPD